MPSRRTLLVLTVLAAPGLASRPARAEALTLRAADGVGVFGTLTPASAAPRGMALLFHMAGANRAEYAAIAPALARRGFASLAIDQRSGGADFGARNETAAALGGRDPGYLAALPDLEAALAWARMQGGGVPILAFGSSYSAALVFLLAARQPGALAALLAFSPGEYLRGTSVRDAAARVDCPVFVASAADPSEVSAARAILAAVPAGVRKVQFAPEVGPHGASLLRADRDPRGAEAAWRAVDGFLDLTLPPRR